MEIRDYVKAASLQEAWELNQKKNNRVAGGNMWLRLSRRPAGTFIDLTDLGLDRIEETGDMFYIGAMVTLRMLEQHKGLDSCSNGSFREALKGIVGTQFRNMATLGGSVAGRFGFSDVLTLLMAMDCEVVLYRGNDPHGAFLKIPIEEFAANGPGTDIVTGVIIYKTPAVYSYQSVRMSSTDFPILSLAAGMYLPKAAGSAEVSGENALWRFAVGAAPYRAVRMEEHGRAGDISAEEWTEKLKARLQKEIRTGSNMRGSAAYRTHLIGVLSERAVRVLSAAYGKEA